MEEKELKTDSLFQAKDLEMYLGKKVTLFCVNYIYHGTLVALSQNSVMLANPAIVYETGDFKSKEYKDIQKLGTPFMGIMRSAIESYCELDKIVK